MCGVLLFFYLGIVQAPSPLKYPCQSIPSSSFRGGLFFHAYVPSPPISASASSIAIHLIVPPRLNTPVDCGTSPSLGSSAGSGSYSAGGVCSSGVSSSVCWFWLSESDSCCSSGFTYPAPPFQFESYPLLDPPLLCAWLFVIVNVDSALYVYPASWYSVVIVYVPALGAVNVWLYSLFASSVSV